MFPYYWRTFATRPCSSQWHVCIFIPFIWLAFPVWGWRWSTSHVISKYTTGELNLETWVLPRLALQFFLPFGEDKINNLIKKEIVEADRIGVKVIALGGLVKNQVSNGRGEIFVRKHPNLHIRVVHGNTLTATLLHELPDNIDQVFRTGSTLKNGKAILCLDEIKLTYIAILSYSGSLASTLMKPGRSFLHWLSLKEQFAAIALALEKLRQQKEERIKLFLDVQVQIQRICGEISGKLYLNKTITPKVDDQDLLKM